MALSLLATDSVVSARRLDLSTIVTTQPVAFEDHACRFRLLARDVGDFAHLDARRLLLRLKSQTSPLDLVACVFSHKADGLVLSSVKFPEGSDQLTTNRELEEIRDLYESKSTRASISWRTGPLCLMSKLFTLMFIN